jgi:hypothetical protein
MTPGDFPRYVLAIPPQPKVAGDLLQAVVYGLIVLALGLGLNVGTLLRGFGIPIGAPSTEADKEQTT